jgi:hypothetical protein
LPARPPALPARLARPPGRCGACMEWLKKIAEVNPAFKIVTFTDTGLRSIYVNNITDG